MKGFNTKRVNEATFKANQLGQLDNFMARKLAEGVPQMQVAYEHGVYVVAWPKGDDLEEQPVPQLA